MNSSASLGIQTGLREAVSLLTRHRQLTWEMAKREITEKYSGQIFGALWAVAHPLIQIAVYVFIFGVVFRVRIGGTAELPLDYTTYLLAGLIPWLAFQESMAKATTVIVNNANLVKQVVFPIEVLPAKGVIATMLTEIVFLVGLVLYVALRYGRLSPLMLLLPLLLVLQTLAMMGVSYILSALGVYVRDTKDLVQIVLIIGVYLIPTFYLPSAVPTQFRAVLYINPFSYMVWCFQDALYFGRFEHPWAWPVFATFSIGVFAVGYFTFRRLRIMFGNVL